MLLHGQVAPWCVEKGWGGGAEESKPFPREEGIIAWKRCQLTKFFA